MQHPLKAPQNSTKPFPILISIFPIHSLLIDLSFVPFHHHFRPSNSIPFLPFLISVHI